ncbi:toll/interleukin-1 receptor domain-containing protein [Acidimicrobiaceae bacterium]|nr:toll/interleukin-1 receptor domain-containing protein [Acidimicrobiaceae bacterium]
MTVFISFSSKDRKYVSEFLLEAKNQKIPAWAALRRESKTGSDFVKLISRKIEKSSGAILLISKNSINSKFINEQEIPQIIQRSQKYRKYKIVPLVIDDVNTEIHPILKSIDLFNSSSTSLDSLTGRQYELSIKDALSEFSYVKKSRGIKRILISFLFLISMYVILTNTQDVLNNESVEQISEINNPASNDIFDEEKFINVIRSEKVSSEIGKASLISDDNFNSVGKFVCEELSNDRPPYLIYDLTAFKARVLLSDLNLSGGEDGDVTPEMLNALVYHIFNTANEIGCEQSVNIFLVQEKAYLLEYLTNFADFRSDFYNSVYKEEIWSVYYKLDTNSELDQLDLATIEAIDFQFNFFISVCQDDLSDVDTWLEVMQNVFSASENIEDQNYHMDTFEIQFSYIPPIFCTEQVDDGSFLNTGFYFLEYNFDPVFTP